MRRSPEVITRSLPMEKSWLRQYPKGVPEHIDYNRYASLTALMQESFDKHAKRCAYRFMGKAYSFAEIDELSQSFAAYLQSQGLEKGDRVAVMMPNVPQYPVE